MFWHGAMDAGVAEAGRGTLEFEVRDDLADEFGRFRMTVRPPDGGAAKLAGKYVLIWKREGGGWKMHVAIWNSDRPT